MGGRAGGRVLIGVQLHSDKLKSTVRPCTANSMLNAAAAQPRHIQSVAVTLRGSKMILRCNVQYSTLTRSRVRVAAGPEP